MGYLSSAVEFGLIAGLESGKAARPTHAWS